MNLVNDLKNELDFIIETDLELKEYVQSIINQLEIKRVKLNLKDISDLTNEQVNEVIIKNYNEISEYVNIDDEINHNFDYSSRKKDFLLSYIHKAKQENISFVIDKTVEQYKKGETNNPLGYAIMHTNGSVDSRILKQKLIEKGIKL